MSINCMIIAYTEPLKTCWSGVLLKFNSNMYACYASSLGMYYILVHVILIII